jgi:DUF971 family protein
MELGAIVVREVSKMAAVPKQVVTYIEATNLFRVQLPGSEAFDLEAGVVRAHDTSASSINEWTGERLGVEVPEGLKALGVVPLGNYAVQITWQDGFSQVAPFDLLASLQEGYAVQQVQAVVGGVQVTADITG